MKNLSRILDTDEDLAEMIEAVHEKKDVVIADFPFSGVSANHVWVKSGMFTGIPAGEGTIDWDHSDR